MLRAQIGAEPRDDKRDAFEVRAGALERIERGIDVGRCDPDVPVLGAHLPGSEELHHAIWLVAELGRAGDERDGAHHALERADRAHDLKRKLRDAVAEILQRQPLEHHIGKAAIGRRIVGAVGRDDQRIGRLRLVAEIEAIGQAGEIEQLAVDPDAPDAPNRAGAQADREVREVAVGGRRGGRARQHAALPARGLAVGRCDLFERRCPDHLAGKPRAPIDARDRRALSRGHDVEVGETRTLDIAVAAAAEQRVVDDVTADRARNAARDRADRPEQAADRATRDGENKGCHHVTPGKANA